MEVRWRVWRVVRRRGEFGGIWVCQRICCFMVNMSEFTRVYQRCICCYTADILGYYCMIQKMCWVYSNLSICVLLYINKYIKERDNKIKYNKNAMHGNNDCNKYNENEIRFCQHVYYYIVNI